MGGARPMVSEPASVENPHVDAIMATRISRREDPRSAP